MTRRLALAALTLAACSNPRSGNAPIVAEPPAEVASTPPTHAAISLSAPVRFPRIRPAPEPALQPLLDELRRYDAVGGAAVGFAGVESPFHRVRRDLVPKADRGLFRWLAEDDHPIIRALGFAGLASIGEKDTLLRHVCDREQVGVFPGGCVGHGQSTGSIAQEFLWSPGWLWSRAPDAGSDALLSSNEKSALAVRVAAVDGCSLGGAARDELKRLGVSGWTWEVVRALTFDVPAWIVVKAVARFESEAARPMLIAVLDDESLPSRARLAAASGLTLTPFLDAEAALVRQAAFLDGHRKGLGNELVEVVRMRRRADVLLAKLDASTTLEENEKHASDAVAVYALRHPFMLDRVEPRHYGARDADVELAHREALLWVSEHLADHAECWSVYRGLAYRFERMLDLDRDLADKGVPRDHRQLGKQLSESELARFDANVRAAVARLDRDLTCLE